MPERADALYEVAQAVEHVGDSVDQLTGELRAARDKTHQELTHVRRLTVLVLFGLLGLTVMAVVSAYTLFLVNDTISPSGKRFKQGQARTAQLLTTLAIEDDCRVRRAFNGLPAPNSDGPCPAQTPPEAYPGVRADMPPRPNG